MNKENWEILSISNLMRNVYGYGAKMISYERPHLFSINVICRCRHDVAHCCEEEKKWMEIFAYSTHEC